MRENAPPDRAPRFGFRSISRGGGTGFGPASAALGAVLVAAVVATFVWSAVAGSATPAQHPRIFGGSIVLDDVRPLVVLDLATGNVTVRLGDVFSQVNATSYSQVQAVPLTTGTLLVNNRTGSFNLLGKDNFVLKRDDGGVGLGSLAGTTGAEGFADGASGYIVRFAPASTVSLVGADTVEAAVRTQVPGSNGTVTPRGFAALTGAVPAGAANATVDAGDLFVVVRRDGEDRVDQLSPSATSAHGLAVADRGAVAASTRPVALESATTAGPAGLVGAASPGQVRLFPPAGPPGDHRDVAVPATATATALVPVSGAQGALWYAARLATGWSLYGITPGGQVLGPHPMDAIPPGTDLARPAYSSGALYTMATNGSDQPALWKIALPAGTVTTVAGEATYPRQSSLERVAFTDTQVVGSGPRIIFDNPESLLGVVVFTDGSHAPVTFDKSAAVTVSATGPVALTGAKARRTTASQSAHATPTTVPAAPPPSVAPQVSQQVNCATTTETPRAPQITTTAASAHSVLVGWSYPLLDSEDCEPDSWAVTVRSLQGPQPDRPERLESGQLQYEFTGLRPTTTYSVSVTAYIAHQSTPSAPAQFTTAATGPDAPTSVRTASDGKGDWIVSWTPCTAVTCYVPAATWTVTGAACTAGFVGQPPSLQVPGGQDSVTINADSLGLLGSSLTFQVQGQTASGLNGDPTADHSCTQAWRPPNPAVINVSAAAVAAADTVTATVDVATDGTPDNEAYGSNATDFTYHVGDRTVGPTTAVTATINGLAAGQSYTPTVVVTPVGHPAASVTLTGQPFTRNLPWPSDLAEDTSPAVRTSDPNLGSVTASFPGAPDVPLAATGQLTCGALSEPVAGDLSGAQELVVPMNLIDIGGTCILSVTLSEIQTHEYGVPSPRLSSGFQIGTLVDGSTFSTSYQYQALTPPHLGFDITAVINGANMDEGARWDFQVTSPPSCRQVGASYAQLGGPPTMPVDLDLGTCDNQSTPPAPVTVLVSYTYLGSLQQFQINPTNVTPPSTTTTTSSTTSSTTSTTLGSTTTKPTLSIPGQAAGPAAGGGASPATVLAGADTSAAPGPGQQSGQLAADIIIILSALALVGAGAGGRRRRKRS